MLRGVDVSNNQPGTINWQSVKESGISFAVIKRSEGSTFADPDFDQNWSGAHAVGLVRGAYHYARPDKNDPITDANYFLSLLPELQPSDMVALDVEVGSGDLSPWVLTWLKHVEVMRGVRPLLYANAYYVESFLQNAALAAYPLWLASYIPTRPTGMWPPNNIWPWAQPTLWQWSATTSCPGVIGNVDESVTALSVDQLRALGKAAPAPPPPPTPPAKPRSGHVKKACALKEAPNHTCPALAQIPANGKILVTHTKAKDDQGSWWTRCGYGDGQAGPHGTFFWGYLLARDVVVG